MSTPAADTSKLALVRPFIEEYFDAWSGTDIDRIMSYYAEDVVLRIPNGEMNGRAAVLDQFVRPFVAAFPGNVHAIQNFAHTPNLAAVEWLFEATHRGTFAGIPPSGCRVQVPGCSIYEFDLTRRMITAGRVYFDPGQFFAQLGERLA